VPIRFRPTLFPAREGPSQAYIERARAPSSDWAGGAQLDARRPAYTPSCDDVGAFLRIAYTPATPEGLEGATAHAYAAARVIAAMPAFANPVIAGVAKTGRTLVALADYSGGARGECAYNWYFSRHRIAPGADLARLALVAAGPQAFVPPEDLAEG
jgi:hypothetical protein